MLTKNKKIDFICIGASKSGTTFISSILKNDSEFYIPSIKEVNYFNEFIPQDYVTRNINFNYSHEWYNKFFEEGLSNNQICGELTPCYFNFDSSSKKIYDYNPEIKLFAILRNPVERAYSQFLYARQNGVENSTSFIKALNSNTRKYVGESLYFKNLHPFFKIFKNHQIKIFIYDDFFENPQMHLEDLFKFLGKKNKLNSKFDFKKVNIGKASRFSFFSRIIGKANIFLKNPNLYFLRKCLKKIGFINIVKFLKNLNLKKRKTKKPSQFEYREAQKFFIDDIRSLEKLLSINLQKWKI
tara:strand:+ start:3587 stop:4480 length:894 start_codon:yes stop_codon:yes gene_type:complete